MCERKSLTWGTQKSCYLHICLQSVDFVEDKAKGLVINLMHSPFISVGYEIGSTLWLRSSWTGVIAATHLECFGFSTTAEVQLS
jgi:hypothetical protein